MARTKRIMISLPQNLLKEVDGVVEMERRTRSEFIREAMKLYLQERRKKQIRERMQEGYMEMARLNLTLANEAINAENEADRLAVKILDVKRGFIFFSDLSPVIGSEQGGFRPVLVIQNNVGNKYSPTVIVAAITSHIEKAKLPTHVELSAKEYGLEKDSVILLEQIRTIDKQRLQQKITELDERVMTRIDEALKISLGLIDF